MDAFQGSFKMKQTIVRSFLDIGSFSLILHKLEGGKTIKKKKLKQT